MAQGAALVFIAECDQTRPGDAVFIVGSDPQLGAWKPEKALRCATDATLYPRWKSNEIVVPISSGVIEFKLLVQAADLSRPSAAKWEAGPNRSIKLAADGSGKAQLTVNCTWGKAEVVCRTRTMGTRGDNSVADSRAPGGFMPRVDSAALYNIDEGGDGVAELQSASSMMSMMRMASRHNALSASAVGRTASMRRAGSRHLCMNGEGILNHEMSKTPSMMMLDAARLTEDCKAHADTVERLERHKLNVIQRRMPSGNLLEGMKAIIDTADKNRIVLMQGFNWESWRAGAGDWYGVVGKCVDRISAAGVTDIWLPPASQSVAPQGYLPSQLFNLDSKYGTQASLEDLISNLHLAGIRAVADIVVNHRCGDQQDSEGRWNQFTSGMTARPSFAGVLDWGGWAITLGDKFSDGTGENHPDQHDGMFDAAPDIDHKNKKVQDGISIWMRWLQLQVGFDAFRFDFVKGYSAEFVGTYCKRSAPSWAVGELWGDMQYDNGELSHNQDRHRQDLVNWVNATDKQSTAFDFTTKGILQEAMRSCQYWRLRDSSGKPPGLIGWMPKYAVTFIDNHDTGSTQRHWPFPDDKVLAGYAYILTHPGIPSLFWDHVMDWGEHTRSQITEMIRARRESGIPADAAVNIICAENDSYVAEIGSPAALRVALGPRHCEADAACWQQGPTGNQYRVWVRRSPAANSPAAPAPKASPTPIAEKRPLGANTATEPVDVGGIRLTKEKIAQMSKAERESTATRLEAVTKELRGK